MGPEKTAVLTIDRHIRRSLNVVYMIYSVPADAAEAPEQLGTKPKFWFTESDGRRLLFKEARTGTGED
jgi:hypothetical protein